jgi:hypothetical protein
LEIIQSLEFRQSLKSAPRRSIFDHASQWAAIVDESADYLIAVKADQPTRKAAANDSTEIEFEYAPSSSPRRDHSGGAGSLGLSAVE